jgi:hypothetical protein
LLKQVKEYDKPDEGTFTCHENYFKQFPEHTKLRVKKHLGYDVGQTHVPRELYSHFEFFTGQATSEFWGFSGPPLGSILIHKIQTRLGTQIFRNPLKDGLSATLVVVGEDENSYDEFAMNLGVKVVSGAGFPVGGSRRKPLGARIVAIFKVEEVDIRKSSQQFSALFGVVSVRVPHCG